MDDEVVCDPPYSVVDACKEIGIRMPKDVVWVHHACRCGQPMPVLSSYHFHYSSGEKDTYAVGQCQHCNTVHWEKR